MSRGLREIATHDGLRLRALLRLVATGEGAKLSSALLAEGESSAFSHLL